MDKTEIFNERVKKLTNNEIEFIGPYTNNKTYSKFFHHTANGGHFFDLRPDRFVAGDRCTVCSKTRRKTIEEVKQKIFDLEGNNYILLSEKYKNNKEKLLFKHNIPECQKEFLMSAHNFFGKKENGQSNRCPFCSHGHSLKSQEQFEKEVFDQVKDEYTVLGEYKGTETKILMKHNICSLEYLVTPNSFLNGKRRCPKCLRSHFEIKIENYLKENNLFKNSEVINEQGYFYDFVLTNEIIIEYDGRQHFVPVEAFGGEDEFKIQHKRDLNKNNFIKENKKTMIRISYLNSEIEFEKILELIKSQNFSALKNEKVLLIKDGEIFNETSYYNMFNDYSSEQLNK